MRSFIISILCTAVFFVGISALIEDVSAKFRADENAMELLKKSRAAIGGEKNIAMVKSMTILGEIDYFENHNVKNIKKGGLEINFRFPDRFAKMIRIGDPGKDPGGKKPEKRIERIIVSDDAEFKSSDNKGNNKSVIIKKGGDHELHEVDENVELKDGKVIIRKKNGSVEEIKAYGKENVFILKDGDGSEKTWESKDGKKVVIRKKGGEEEKFVWKSKDGRKVKSGDHELHEVRVAGGGGNHQNEFLQTTLALLLTAPDKLDVTYNFLGTGDVGGKSSNIIEVNSRGSKFKLYLDSASNLPLMISYSSHNLRFGSGLNNKMKIEEEIETTKRKVVRVEKNDSKPMVHELRFADFRRVEGLLMPHKWNQFVEGKPNQTMRITSYQVNPSNIDEKFKQNNFKREMKFESIEKKNY